MLDDSIWLPRLLGWIPSCIKSDALSQKRLKLSMKWKLWAGQVAWSQVWRLRILLKRSAPRPSVGMGPEIKTVFPVSFKRLKSRLKSLLVTSDFLREVSFEPTCTTIFETEEGREGSRWRSLSRMTGTVAPGKQCVMALKNLMYLVIESPMISVVAGRRGRGGEERALKPPALGRSTCAETGADGPAGVRVLDGRERL